MRELHIAYLYYDLLNLYGEKGNIKILKKQLEEQGILVYVHFLTLEDEFHFEEYDFVYIGAGTEDNQKIVLPHLLKYKDEIKEYIEKGKFVLATGNSLELFGKQIEVKEEIYETLDIFDYYTKQEEFRMIDECIFTCSFLEKPLIGFQNQYTVTKNISSYLFDVKKGIGSYPNAKKEGIKYKNFYGTYLIGPILIRNPHFLEYLIKELILSKYPDFELKKCDLEIEYRAYYDYNNYFNKGGCL